MFFIPSFAQTPELELVALFEYRNSNGDLLAYFVDSSPGIVDQEAFVAFLDTAPEQLVTIHDDYKVITTGGAIEFPQYMTSSKTYFADSDGIAHAFADHNAVFVEKGDILTTTWIVTVPLD